MKKGKHTSKEKKIFSNTIQNILLIISITIFIFSSYKIIMYLIDANTNKKLNENLIEEAIIPNEKKDTIEDKNNEINEMNDINTPFTVDFSVLQQQNKDVVGWIYLKNSPINFPVLQSKDNDYYLRRLITGKYNRAGSIFMDYRNNKNITDKNTIIYGHNMKNDTMFGTLTKYRKQDYYNNHKIIYLFTPEKNYEVKIFSGFTESVDSEIYNLNNMNQDKINELIKKSDFKTQIEVNEDSKILTMSTCAYEYNGARYIVMGILEEI